MLKKLLSIEKKKEYKLHFRPHSHTVIYLMFSAGERVELQPSKTCIHSQTHNMIDTLCRLLDLAYLKQGHAMPISNFTWQLGQEFSCIVWYRHWWISKKDIVSLKWNHQITWEKKNLLRDSPRSEDFITLYVVIATWEGLFCELSTMVILSDFPSSKTTCQFDNTHIQAYFREKHLQRNSYKISKQTKRVK